MFSFIVTADDLAANIGCTSAQAARELKLVILPPRLAEMLREAGAPEPWRVPEPTTVIGRFDTDIDLDTDEGSIRLRKIREAVNTLRELLPDHIRCWEQTLQEANNSPILPDIIRARGEHNLHAFRALSGAVSIDALPMVPPKQKRKTAAMWHQDARTILRVYRKIVDQDCGTSAEGPAVRFVAAALAALRQQRHELKAIAAALRTTAADR
jgi:hypothetical protein